MGFRTKLDYSDNRQIKQRERTLTNLSGGTVFGVPFSALTTGVDPSNSAVTETYTTVVSTFSGNATTTNFTWYDPRMDIANSSISAITSSNSGTSQNSGNVFVVSSTGTTADGYDINLEYTGTSFDLVVSSMFSGAGPVYSGTVTHNEVDFLSAGTLDYKDRTIWIDNPEITRTNRLIVTNNPSVGYVLTCDSVEGEATWSPVSAATSGATFWEEDGTGNGALKDVKGSHTINGVSDNSIIAGGEVNTISGGTRGAIIGGGGNYLSGDSREGIILGGSGNTMYNTGGSIIAASDFATMTNNQTGLFASRWNVMLGTSTCTMFADVDFATILGSSNSTIDGDNNSTIIGSTNSSVDSGDYNTIIGSRDAHIDGNYSFIIGSEPNGFGSNNEITADNCSMISSENSVIDGTNTEYSVVMATLDAIMRTSDYSIIAGGEDNWMYDGSDYSAIIAGRDNRVSASTPSVIVGGQLNDIYGGGHNLIAGGTNHNINTTNYAGLFAGTGNTITENATGLSSPIGSAIVGGKGNTIIPLPGSVTPYSLNSGAWSVIAGGESNTISGHTSAFIGGGENNLIDSDLGWNAIIAGGSNDLKAGYSAIIGGLSNTINYGSDRSVTIGGQKLDIGTTGGSDFTKDSVIAGGNNNNIYNNADESFIGGGSQNNIDGADESSIIGGLSNTITGSTANRSVIAGGWDNDIFDSKYTSIIGGYKSKIQSTSSYSTILGGYINELSGSEYTTIVGGRYSSGYTSDYGFMGGGLNNRLEGATYSAIIGGRDNVITGDGSTNTMVIIASHNSNLLGTNFGFIAGSLSSTIYYSPRSVIVGGDANTIANDGNTVFRSGIFAGSGNTITDGDQCAIIGGTGNIIDSSAGDVHSVIIGGEFNVISNADRSVIIGGTNITATTDDMVYVPDLTIDGLVSVTDLQTNADGKLINGVSDITFKDKVETLTGSLDTILKLNPVSFEWKPEIKLRGGKVYGLIAQEVKEILPEIVRERAKGNGTLTLDYKEIIPWLIGAIQELTSSGSPLFNRTELIFETQTIASEDNNIELNYGGTHESSLDGGLTVVKGIDENNDATLMIDSSGDWTTNTHLKPSGLVIPEFTPTSSNDNNGKIGEVTRDDEYLYIKTKNGWRRTGLETF